MNWLTAAGTGFGLGLAYFGALWLSVRRVRNEAGAPARLAAGRMCRLGLAGLTFYALLKTGGGVAVVAGLGGFTTARWYLVRGMRSAANGQ